MLRKLLKYDFASVFKLWWIAALSSFGLSLLAGGCINVLNVGRNLPTVVDTSAAILLVLSIIGIIAFTFVSLVLVYVRFYKNLYTDEGYLTFTLPVKTSQILNSKIILALVTLAVSGFVVCFDIFTMFAIGLPDQIFDIKNYEFLIEAFGELVKHVGWYLPVYIIEGIILGILGVLFTQLLLFACITFASLITKKSRVITAIAIYYGVNCVLSFVIQILIMFSAPIVFEHLNLLSESMFKWVFIIVLLCAVVFCFMCCVMLYILQYWMMDKKLNLS